MKRILLFFWMSLTGILCGFADSAIVFVDADGQEVKDGATLTVNTATQDEFGEILMLSGLSIKNVSDEAVSASIHVNIKSISNGKLQICFPTTKKKSSWARAMRKPRNGRCWPMRATRP